MVAPARTAVSVLATASSLSLCVWMPIGRAELARDVRDRGFDFVRQRPPLVSHRVRYVRAAALCSAQSSERVGRVVRVAVEEVLGVEHDLVDVLLEVADRVLDQLEVLLRV